MAATPSLRPIFSFSGWVIDRINIDWEASEAIVFLRRDGRTQKIKCSQCHHVMEKMREKERSAQDLPLGSINVRLQFTAYQGVAQTAKSSKFSRFPGLLQELKLLTG